MAINERRVKSFFTDSGWHVHEVDVNGRGHWRVRASKATNGPMLKFTMSGSPSCPYFDMKVAADIRRAERGHYSNGKRM
jgi:hypothetical protein